VKPGPVIAMLCLVFVGMWLVLQPYLALERLKTEGANTIRLTIGPRKAICEQRPVPEAPGRYEYRFIDWPEKGREWMSGEEFQAVLESESHAWGAIPKPVRFAMGLFNVTSWHNLIWVAIGLGGQAAFFGRMLIQWVVSEKRRQSVVPTLFWWLSFIGGLCLFIYFVWRVDFVGVLGQTTGVVIYARNLRLIHKERRRAARRQAQAQAG
jgi:lipid-A-disaccharide synthase-like uncharacterized protein